MRESKIETEIVAEAARLGVLAWKFTGQPGAPDRLLIGRDGRVAFLEIKAPGKVPRPLQVSMIDKLHARGVTVGWVDSVEGGRAFLLAWLGEETGCRCHDGEMCEDCAARSDKMDYNHRD